MARSVALVLLVLLLAVGAAACGGGEEAAPTAETVIEGGDTGTDGGSGTTTDEETETETDEGTGTETNTQTATEAGAAEGDPAKGKQLFASQGCGGCHTLSDAGANGNVGPNLDDAQPDHELVVERVTNGSGAMPSFKDKLTEAQIDDVAAYVVDATQS